MQYFKEKKVNYAKCYWEINWHSTDLQIKKHAKRDFRDKSNFSQIVKIKSSLKWVWELEKKQVEIFCTRKEASNKMKWQPKEWEKIFENHISDKGLISKIHKESIHSMAKKKKPTKNKTIWSQNGQNIWINIFAKNRYRSQVHRKMFNIINHQGNANQKHEI